MKELVIVIKELVWISGYLARDFVNIISRYMYICIYPSYMYLYFCLLGQKNYSHDTVTFKNSKIHFSNMSYQILLRYATANSTFYYNKSIYLDKTS